MSSTFSSVEQAPPIQVFQINEMCKKDPSDLKVNMTIGAYQDENAKPWVLPVVRMVERKIVEDPTLNHEYLPITGIPEYCEAAVELLLGDNSAPIVQKRAFAVQALGGTGSIRLGAEFLRFAGRDTVYIPKPTWPNHRSVFVAAHFPNVKDYTYLKSDKTGFGLEEMMKDLGDAPEGAIVILHGCAHNPSGVDPKPEEWQQIMQFMKEKKLFPFFDLAYQGFASGDPDKDAAAVRLFTENGFEFFTGQSFSKNFGLYGERVGALTVVLNDPDACIRVRSQMTRIVRALWSNPPTYGARVVATVLRNPQYKKEWLANLNTMSQRIISMRHELYRRLRELATPGCWKHIIEQQGLFSYTGLKLNQVERLRNEFHIYLLNDGRANMCGLTPSNVQHVAESIHTVVSDDAKGK